MRVHADGHRDVVDLVVGEQAVAPTSQALSTCAQRQDGLGLCRAPSSRSRRPNRPRPGTPVERGVAASQSVSLPGSTATPEPLRFPPSGWRCRVWAWRITRLGQALAVLDMLVQPQLQRRPQKLTQPQRIARIQPLLGLALNCGSSTLADSTKLAREKHVLGISFTPWAAASAAR